MKVYVLMDNVALSEEYICEHGLSLYIETGDTKILFDTGKSDDFLKNAQKLDVDIADIDIAFLSHGHYDHGGGIKAFFDNNKKAKLYLSKLAFGDYYNGTERYIGLDKSLKTNDRLIFVNDEIKLGTNITFISCNDKKKVQSINSDNLTKKIDESFIEEDFLYEEYLIIEEDNKKVLISGCSHKGIVNIMKWINPDICLGGFHFMNEDIVAGKNENLDNAADTLLKYNCKYYTCHCTGFNQYNYLKESMKDKLEYISAGMVVEL